MNILLEPSFDTPLVSFHIANALGTAADPVGLEGLVCHSAEMAFRGAGPLTRDEFDDSVDTLGAALGIGTRRDYLSLRGTCLARHLDALFDLAISTIRDARFEEEEHQQLLRETSHELDDLRDDDASLAHRFLNRHMHPGYTYCRTALGTAESLGNIHLKQSRELHKKLFSQPDLILGIAGPIDLKKANELRDRMGAEDGGQPSQATDLMPPEAPAGRRLVLVDKPNREQCQVAMGHLAPAYGTDAYDRMQVAEAAFGGMFTSRLMQEIRVKEGWSYGAHCSMYRARGRHGLQLTMAPGADVCAKAVARMLELFSELHQDGLSAQEFDFTRSYLQGSACFERATANQRLFRSIQEDVFDLPRGYADGYPERLAAMSVGDVNGAIGEHCHPNDLCVVVVATADTMLAQLESLGWDRIDVVPFDSY